MATSKPILVTGSHRSGTTWVGKMIAASSQVGYIHEPFNPLHRPGICAARFPYTFAYVTEENEVLFYEHLKATLSFHFNIGAALAAIEEPRDVGRMLKDYTRITHHRLRHAIPLLKDPIAVFSTPWLAKRFDMNVIVMIRHPAAFASSIRRFNWRFDFSHFLQQPLLMRDHLFPFETEIAEFANTEHDILDQAVLLWRLIYYMVLKHRNAHEHWIFLRHEDIAAEPFPYFAYLFKMLQLDFSEQVKAVIHDYTNSSNPCEARQDAMFGKRDSSSIIRSWKEKFTQAEITRVRKGVEDVAHAFYLDNEW